MGNPTSLESQPGQPGLADADPADPSAAPADEGPLATQPKSRKSIIWGTCCAVLVAALGMAWALASPPMSSPDDDFHLASIWCAWGQQASDCRVISASDPNGPLVVDVDPLGPYVSDCMAFHPETSGSCIFLRPDGTTGLVPDRNYPSRANNGGYPRLFYATMRLLVTPDVPFSIIAMRWVNWVIACGVILAGALLLSRPNRARVLMAAMVAAVPLGLFIFASTNPSSWAVSGVFALFLAVAAGLSEPRPKRQILAGVLAGFGMLLACGSRPDSSYFCVIALAAALAVGRVWRIRSRMHAVRVLAIPAVGLVLAILATPITVTGAAGQRPQPNPGDLVNNSLQVLAFYVGDFATSLGWVDTHMPALVWGAVALALGGLLTLGMAEMDLGRALALALVAAAAVILPIYLLNLWGATIFVEIQPRYFLSLVLIGAALCALRLPRPRVAWDRGAVVMLGFLACLAHTVALHTLLRRYVAGLDVMSLNLNRIDEWWWGLPGGPGLVWVVGASAFVALMGILGLQVIRSTEPREVQGAARLGDPLTADAALAVAGSTDL